MKEEVFLSYYGWKSKYELASGDKSGCKCTIWRTRLANVSGVNVISPTWYYIQDTAGNIGNIASADYVALAHERGLKVWGLIDNFTAEVSTTTDIFHSCHPDKI